MNPCQCLAEDFCTWSIWTKFFFMWTFHSWKFSDVKDSQTTVFQCKYAHGAGKHVVQDGAPLFFFLFSVQVFICWFFPAFLYTVTSQSLVGLAQESKLACELVAVLTCILARHCHGHDLCIAYMFCISMFHQQSSQVPQFASKCSTQDCGC